MKIYIKPYPAVINGSMDYSKFLTSVSALVNKVQKALKQDEALDYDYVSFNVYIPKYADKIEGFAKVFENRAMVELKITQNNQMVEYRTRNTKTAFPYVDLGYIKPDYGGLGKYVADYIDYCYTLQEYPYKGRM